MDVVVADYRIPFYYENTKSKDSKGTYQALIDWNQSLRIVLHRN